MQLLIRRPIICRIAIGVVDMRLFAFFERDFQLLGDLISVKHERIIYHISEIQTGVPLTLLSEGCAFA